MPHQDSYKDCIAVIGIAGRFPGARDIGELWTNLLGGVESIFDLSEEELSQSGVPKSSYTAPNYIRRRAYLADSDCFDHVFFGYSKADAVAMDPQHRVFLECCWNALENAGYDPFRYDGWIAVFAGANAAPAIDISVGIGVDFLQRMVSSDKDFLASRVAYKLNLKGPAITVQTACSTSAVAVHTAIQNLLTFQCDMAIAGGTSIASPSKIGYLYSEGAIFSRDGHCRPFDYRAAGTVFGDAVGAVVLKRYEDAIADRDHVWAIIRGSAVNNDGARKAGFAAPSVAGQEAVLKLAHIAAGVSPGDISYIEAHGTGTLIGDPIEVSALKSVFCDVKTGSCALGSVKANIGHTNCAAGIASIIRTILSLNSRLIPPCINYEKPNPLLELEKSPFFINSAVKDWEPIHGRRIAGVSSFGVGGTNAHIVIEEAPDRPSSRPTVQGAHLIVLSAKTDSAIKERAYELRKTLQGYDYPVEDVSDTLLLGRAESDIRAAFTVRTRDELIEQLSKLHPIERRAPHQVNKVFVFTGSNVAYPNMARSWFDKSDVFRTAVMDCARRFEELLAIDVLSNLYPGSDDSSSPCWEFSDSIYAPICLFSVEYALISLLAEFGVHPDIVMGQNLGEITAAFAAGVLSFDQATARIARRACESQPRSERAAVSFAALELNTESSAARIPFVSLSKGLHIPAGELPDAECMGDSPEVHVPPTTAAFLHDEPDGAFMLQIGPGRDLLHELNTRLSPCPGALYRSLPSAIDRDDPTECLLHALGQLWCRGAFVQWSAVRANSTSAKVPLPGYPFERALHVKDTPGASAQVDSLETAFARPKAHPNTPFMWKPIWLPRPPTSHDALQSCASPLIVFSNADGQSGAIIHEAAVSGVQVVEVLKGTGFERLSATTYRVTPDSLADHARLFALLDRTRHTHASIIYLWASEPAAPPRSDGLGDLTSIAALVRAAVRENWELNLTVATRGAQSFDRPTDTLCPSQHAMTGMLAAVKQEHPSWSIRLADVFGKAQTGAQAPVRWAPAVYREHVGNENDFIVAYRDAGRFVLRFVESYPCRKVLDGWRAKKGAVYVITGGFGGIGLAVASHVSTNQDSPTLVLTSRHPVSASDEVAHLTRLGARVVPMVADISVEDDVKVLFSWITENLGTVAGVFHCAGINTPAPLHEKSDADFDAVLHPKTVGTTNILKYAEPAKPGFIVLFSSLSAALGGHSISDYSAANAYMDAAATKFQERTGIRTVSIAWDFWTERGMSARAGFSFVNGLTTAEGLQCLDTVLADEAESSVLVSKRDLNRIYLSLLNGPPSPAGSRLALDVSSSNQLDPKESLRRCWTSVLGVDEVSDTDDFYALGGDSLSVVQLANGIKKALAIDIKPDLLTDSSVFTEMLRVVLEKRTGPAQSDPLPTETSNKAISVPVPPTGSCPLSVSQSWILSQNFQNAAHWNNGVQFTFVCHIDPSAAKSASQRLIQAHAALRARFSFDHGQWTQYIPDIHDVPTDAYHFLDHSHLSQSDCARRTTEAIDKIQGQWSLSGGGLCAFIHVRRPSPLGDALFLIAHHLVIDNTGFRILSDDLLCALQSASSAGPQEAPESASFRQWSLRLSEHASSAAILTQRDYWDNLPFEAVPDLRTDYLVARSANTIGSARALTRSIGRAATARLLQLAKDVYGVNPSKVLTGIFASCIGAWLGSPYVMFKTMNSGRNILPESDRLNLSRTVGCLAYGNLVFVRVDPTRPMHEQLRHYLDQLAKIPNEGADFEILHQLSKDAALRLRLDRVANKNRLLFNYLGNVTAPRSSILASVKDYSLNTRSAEDLRADPIEVNAYLLDSEVVMDWRYSKNLHKASTIETLSDAYVELLSRLVVQAGSGHTPKTGDTVRAGDAPELSRHSRTFKQEL